MATMKQNGTMKVSPVKKRSPPYTTRNYAFKKTVNINLSPLKQSAKKRKCGTHLQTSPVKSKRNHSGSSRFQFNRISNPAVSPVKRVKFNPKPDSVDSRRGTLRDVLFDANFNPRVSPVKKSKNKYDTSYLKRPQLTLSQQNILRMTGIQARGDDGSGLDYSNINNQKKFNKNYHVQADYYGLFQKLGDHRKAREALRNEEKFTRNYRARQFEESMDEYSARIQKRIDHAISKTYGPLPGRKILPMSRFTVEHVPPIPDPPAVKHVQTLFYNNAIADKSNPDAVPVYDPEKDAKTKRLTKYAEKELTISNPERRALRKSFAGPSKREIIATGANLLSICPSVGSSTLSIQIPYARIQKLVYTNNKITSFNPVQMKSKVPFLRQLSLGQNAIREMPENIGKLASLRILDLHSNMLQKLPSSLTKLCRLEVLDVSLNALTSLPANFGGLKKLSKLNALGNKLTKLPDGIQHCLNLKDINFKNNKILVIGQFPVPKLKEDKKDYNEDDLWEELDATQFNKGKAYKNLRTYKLQREAPTQSIVTRHQQLLGDIEVSLEALLPPKLKKREMLDFSALKEEGAPVETLMDALAMVNESIWSCGVNVESGNVYYKNCINDTTTYIMPAELDFLPYVKNMVTIKLNFNGLRSIPDSIGKLCNLKHLELDSNRIRDVPLTLCELNNLESLSIGNNIIERLPLQLGRLTKLKSLRLQFNAIGFLPGSIGSLVNLKLLWLGHNRLKRLPRTFGRLAGLEDLQLFDNPMVTPPMWIIENGKDHVIHYCLQRLIEKEKGLPPMVELARVGVNKEVIVPLPRLKMEISIKCDNACRSGKVYLNWLELEDFPEAIYENASKIKEIRFVGNCMRTMNPQIGKFENLRIAYLSANKIESLPNTFGDCKILEELYLSENLISEIPNSICRLPQLKVLNFAHNRLKAVPKRLKTMRKLEVLNLDSNVIKEVPDGMEQMKKLVRLSLGSNKIKHLPLNFGLMPSLTFINLNSNLLRRIPDSFANFENLRELRLASNRLVALPKEIGRDIDVEGMYSSVGNSVGEAQKEHNKIGDGTIISESNISDKFADGLDELTDRFEAGASKLKIAAAKKAKKIKKQLLRYVKHISRDPATESERNSIRGKAVLLGKKMFKKISASEEYQLAVERAQRLRSQMEQKYSETQLAKLRAKRKRRRLRIKKYKSKPGIIKGTLNLKLTSKGFLKENLSLYKTKAGVMQLLRREIRKAKYPSSEESEDDESTIAVDQADDQKATIMENESGNQKLDMKGALEYKASPLAASLEVLWLSGNNLRALPDSFGHFKNVKRLTLELNPIVSPPRIVSRNGPDILELYFKVKSKRYQNLVHTVNKLGLRFNFRRLTPVAEGFWKQDDQGFITQDDLDTFEQQINSYLNAQFYLFRFTPVKMIKDIISLREDREQLHYKRVLERIVKLLWMIEGEKERNFSFLTQKIFVKNVRRPWGLNGEEVDCFGIDLNYIFEAVEGNDKSVIDIYRSRPKVSAGDQYYNYIYSVGEIAKASEIFNRPYGYVAKVNDIVEFEGEWPASSDEDIANDGDTEGDGTKKSKPKKKKKKKRKKKRKPDETPPPAKKKAFVVQQYLYSVEEAARRSDEIEGIRRRYELKLDRFDDYAITKYGKNRLAKKQRLMRGSVSDQVGEERRKLGILEEEKSAKVVTFEAIQERKKLFDEGKEFKYHNFRNADHAETEEYKAMREVEKVQKRINKKKQDIKEKKKLYQKKAAEWKEAARAFFTDIIYNQVKAKVYERHRRRARHLGKRRLWDGRNGEDYQKWLEENGLLHDEKSYSSPEDSSGYDIGLDSDEERERAQEAALEAARIAKERAFVRQQVAELQGVPVEEVAEADIDEMMREFSSL